MKSTGDLLHMILTPSTEGLQAIYDAAISALNDGLELAVPIRAALTRFASNPTAPGLEDLQLEVVRTMPWDLGPSTIVNVVARLTTSGRLSNLDAARILAATPYPRRPALFPEASNLVEVSDAVVEDFAEGIMGVDDDDLFRDAIVGVLRSS